MASIPSELAPVHGSNELQIALCYMPFGAGTTVAAFSRGRIIDSRYRFHA